MKKIKIAIEGGAGYTAGELLRILINHPQVEISYVNSESHEGQAVTSVHTDLLGETELRFGKIDPNKADVLFLCKGHGQSVSYLKNNRLPEGLKIIDLSQDFRTETDGFVYGLPELQREKIRTATKIANPGCFATSIELALLPLAKAGLLQNDIHITAITGSTGAGQSLSETSHFSWRNNNISVYKPFRHQHLTEISMSLKKFQPAFQNELNLIPVRGDFTRGILSSIYTSCSISTEEAIELYDAFYQEHPFVILSDRNPSLKQVINTNKCILYPEKIDNKLLIISLIDNLIKGASGQAVQNMNLMSGFPEDTGLHLKAVAF
ncbi:MAG: N-acetyl-gamma-glutamyl-phosphate reductase [Bacteroidales bacterium]|nr:N-acetyl-gamma-glutamyl-phosphate reductase [Bacteroidales bacterium]